MNYIPFYALVAMVTGAIGGVVGAVHVLREWDGMPAYSRDDLIVGTAMTVVVGAFAWPAAIPAAMTVAFIRETKRRQVRRDALRAEEEHLLAEADAALAQPREERDHR